MSLRPAADRAAVSGLAPDRTVAQRRAGQARAVATLDEAIITCRACPRLVGWREQVATVRRAAYSEQEYWGRPVPGFGPVNARLLVVGLAPAAHGANRTGRMFTGDRSGDWLYASLFRNGLASQPSAVSRDDGLAVDVRITAAVHCAPPDNRPTPAERDACSEWLVREMLLMAPSIRVVLALGELAWRVAFRAGSRAWQVDQPRPLPRFGHGARGRLGDVDMVASYHPSQQNTFTGRLTEQMLDDVISLAARLSEQ